MNAEFICKAITNDSLFQMISLGGFPGIISGDKRIEGEIYEVDDRTLAALDRLEGNGTFYQRIKIKLLSTTQPAMLEHEAFMYVLISKNDMEYRNRRNSDRIIEKPFFKIRKIYDI